MIQTRFAQSFARIRQPFDEFVRAEASGGIVLMMGAVAAMIWANASTGDSYHDFWDRAFTVGFRPWSLTLTLHAWINDALMAVFFFVVGLEIKREVLVGELASLRRAALPIAGALGGMIVPALIFWGMTRGTNAASGWAIPMATDIAFALGVATLLGSYVPVGLKVFLAALAIVDDIGAVLVIAFFYTAEIKLKALAAAAILLLMLIGLNRANVNRAVPYLLIGVLLWLAVLFSGLHATIAGVLLAFTIPATTPDNSGAHAERHKNHDHVASHNATVEHSQSLLAFLEHSLHRTVAFVIMPLFALANAGVHIESDFLQLVRQPVVTAIVAGLLIGKTLGITTFSFVAVRLNIAQLPALSSWRQLIGVATLGGIGFTMSLFIGALAYGDSIELTEARIGVLGGSLIAALVGWGVLRFGRKKLSGVG